MGNAVFSSQRRLPRCAVFSPSSRSATLVIRRIVPSPFVITTARSSPVRRFEMSSNAFVSSSFRVWSSSLTIESSSFVDCSSSFVVSSSSFVDWSSSFEERISSFALLSSSFEACCSSMIVWRYSFVAASSCSSLATPPESAARPFALEGRPAGASPFFCSFDFAFRSASVGSKRTR